MAQAAPVDLPGISRRQFLRRSGLAASGGALGSLVSLGLEPQRVRAATVPLAWKIERTKVVPSICPYCAVGCSIAAHAVGGARQGTRAPAPLRPLRHRLDVSSGAVPFLR
jgi:anaerobic selenocysteine-containing dehydrogenase